MEFITACDERVWTHDTSIIAPRQMVQPRGLFAESRRARLFLGCSVVFLSGGATRWNAIATCASLKNLLADGKTVYEIRYGVPLHGPVVPVVAEYFDEPIGRSSYLPGSC